MINYEKQEVKKKSKMETESDIDDKSLEVKKTKNPFKAANFGDASLFVSLSTKQLYDTFSLRDDDGRSVLHVATSAGQSEIVDFIAKADSCKELINAKDDNGWAPIHFAANNGYLDIIEILAKYGADINLANNCDRTALHYAVTGGRVKTAELLIGLGANVNAQDKVGFAPLHRAAGRGYLDLCELLINEGAKVDVLDHTEQTPLVNAVICKQKEVAVYLIKKGAEWFKLDEPNEKDETHLEHAPEDLKDAVCKTVRQLGMMYDQPLARPSLYWKPQS